MTTATRCQIARVINDTPLQRLSPAGFALSCIERLLGELGIEIHPRPDSTPRVRACGCVFCVCADPDRCSGCGARFCERHGPSPTEPSRPPESWIGNELHNRRMTADELAAQVPFTPAPRKAGCPACAPVKNRSGPDPLLERDRQPVNGFCDAPSPANPD